jgi:hypothetical protein
LATLAALACKKGCVPGVSRSRGRRGNDGLNAKAAKFAKAEGGIPLAALAALAFEKKKPALGVERGLSHVGFRAGGLRARR